MRSSAAQAVVGWRITVRPEIRPWSPVDVSVVRQVRLSGEQLCARELEAQYATRIRRQGSWKAMAGLEGESQVKLRG